MTRIETTKTVNLIQLGDELETLTGIRTGLRKGRGYIVATDERITSRQLEQAVEAHEAQPEVEPVPPTEEELRQQELDALQALTQPVVNRMDAILTARSLPQMTAEERDALRADLVRLASRGELP